MNRLILFYRPDRSSGGAKTRIAAEIGTEAAAKLYRAMLADLAENLAGFSDILFPAADAPDHVSAPGDPGRALLTPAAYQRGADLGERMENAFRDAFREGIERAVLIGSDIPHIEPAAITRSFADLLEFDVVLGPALDGGYYLIGLTGDAFGREDSFNPEDSSNPGGAAYKGRSIFRDIPWSTGGVFQATLERAEAAGLRSSVLPGMRDLDTVNDVRRVIAEHAARLPGLTAAFASVCPEKRPRRDNE